VRFVVPLKIIVFINPNGWYKMVKSIFSITNRFYLKFCYTNGHVFHLKVYTMMEIEHGHNEVWVHNCTQGCPEGGGVNCNGPLVKGESPKM
jgi:hypothetical protein